MQNMVIQGENSQHDNSHAVCQDPAWLLWSYLTIKETSFLRVFNISSGVNMYDEPIFAFQKVILLCFHINSALLSIVYDILKKRAARKRWQHLEVLSSCIYCSNLL